MPRRKKKTHTVCVPQAVLEAPKANWDIDIQRSFTLLLKQECMATSLLIGIAWTLFSHVAEYYYLQFGTRLGLFRADLKLKSVQKLFAQLRKDESSDGGGESTTIAGEVDDDAEEDVDDNAARTPGVSTDALESHLFVGCIRFVLFAAEYGVQTAADKSWSIACFTGELQTFGLKAHAPAFGWQSNRQFCEIVCRIFFQKPLDW
jgi:hypothetical protein